MTVHVDTRPEGIDLMFRPGNSFTLELTWPDSLTGRTFTSTVSSQSLSVTYSNTVMTIEMSDTQTDDYEINVPLSWALSESGNEVIIGTWVPSYNASARNSQSISVRTTAAEIEVNYSSGIGFATAAADIALIKSHNLVAGPYIDIPSGWGERWFTARATAAAGGFGRVILIGDSIMVGWSATTNWFNGYGMRLRDLLQAEYGDGGPGFIGVDFARHSGNVLVAGNPVGVSANGAWTSITSDTGSINAHSVRPTVDGSGATMTFTMATDDQVTIYSRTDPSYGRYDYRINGGSAVQVSQAAAAGIQATNVAVAAGTNTIQLIAASGTCRLLGVKSEYATGLAVHNMSVAGRQTDDFNSSPASFTTTMSALGEHDLMIICLGANDLGTAGRTQTQVEGWVDEMCRLSRTANLTNPPDVAIVIQHRGAYIFDDFQVVWPAVYSALRATAIRNGAALIDVWASGRRSWNYWNSLGYWTDSVHPLQGGHDAYASLTMQALTVTE